VVIPESDFMAEITAANRSAFLITLLALAVSILAGIFIAQRLANSASRLNESIRAFAKDEGAGRALDTSRIREIDELTASFVAMQGQLRQRLDDLRASESRRNEAQRITHIGNWELDLQSNALTWSDEIYRIFGLETQEFKGTYEAFLDAIHPADREMVDQAYSDSLKNRTPYGIDHRLLMKDGSVKFVHEQCETWFDGDGNPLRSIGTVQNITVRKQAEEKLREAEERLELFFSQSLDGFFFMLLDEPARWDDTVDKEKVLDYAFAHQRVTKINNAMLEQYRARREQFLGLTPNDFFAHDLEQGRRVWREFFDSGHLHIETDERRFDGTQMWIEGDYVCMYDNEGRISGHFGIQRDITARKQAEEKIQRQNQRLTALREIDMAILAADSAEDIVGAALSHIRELIGCRRAAVALFDWGENEALMFGVRTMGESSIPQGARVPLASFQDLIQTLSQNQPTIIGDLTVLPDPPPLFQNLIRDGLRSMCILPIFSQSNLIGSFNMSSEIPGFFDEEKINLGREVANQVAIAITQSNLIESLRASEEKYSILFDKSPYAIVLRKMSENTIVGVNDAFLELFGFTRADVIGKTSIELGITGAESPAKVMAEFQARGSLHGFEVVRTTKTGRRLDLSLNWDWVTIGGEKYILNTIQDITEQKLRGRERETLLALAIALRAASNRAEMLPIILDQIISLLNLDGAALASLDSASGEVIVELARGGLEGWSNVRIPPGQGITGIVMASGETYVTNDLNADPNTYRADLLAGEISIACAPLIADKKVIGALWIRSQSHMQDADVRLLEGIANMTSTALQRATLFEQTVQYASQLTDAYEKNIEGWSHALDLRDKETEGHTLRVTALTLKLARAMGIPEADIVHIRRGALLHDIGKMGIPDHILLKPGALTAEEMETMRQHPVFAYELLKPIEFLRDSLDIPWRHHEKWDGTGYPRGLKGEEIPLAARLFAVVDVWDALTSDRPYRQAWSKEKALDYLRQQAGRHFDPHVVELFLKLLKEDAQDAG